MPFMPFSSNLEQFGAVREQSASKVVSHAVYKLTPHQGRRLVLLAMAFGSTCPRSDAGILSASLYTGLALHFTTDD